jgi:hypothetical protein
MKPQNFKSVQWSQRLRGYVNFKTCLALSSISLGSAFAIGLAAQEPKKNEVVGELTSKVPVSLASKSIETARLDNAGRQVAKQVIPNGIDIAGTITGPFAQQYSEEFETKTLSFVEANQRLFKPDAVYDITVDLESKKRNVYDLSLQAGASPSSPDSKPADEILLGVSADTAMQNLRLSGAATGDFLAHNGVSWKVSTQPIREKEVTYSGKIDVKDGVKTQGTIRGLFVNFANDKIERSTQDITDTSEFGPTGAPYEVDVKLINTTSLLHGAILGNPAKEEPLLQVITDVPVKSFHLRGIISGSRFGSSGLAWGFVTDSDMKKITKASTDSGLTPALFTPVSFCESSPLSSSLLYAPEEHQQASVIQVGWITDALNAIGDVLKGRLGNLFKGNIAVSTSVTGTGYVTDSQTKDTNPPDACRSKVDARISGEKPGFVITASSDTAEAGISVLDDWKSQFSPFSVGTQYYSTEIDKIRDVTVHWARDVQSATREISVHYAKDENSPIQKTVKYTVSAKEYLAWYVVNTDSTDCEDADHDGIPDARDTTPNGSPVPVVPTPAPNPG